MFSKKILHLRWGEHNLLEISSIRAFFHIPLLHSKHPVNNILQELINQTYQTQNKTWFSPREFPFPWFFPKRSLFVDETAFRLAETQSHRLMGGTFLVPCSFSDVSKDRFALKCILQSCLQIFSSLKRGKLFGVDWECSQIWCRVIKDSILSQWPD